MDQDSEFYIGWQATAPPSFRRAIRGFVLTLALLIPWLVVAFVYFQNGFSNGVFEFGKTTELQGVYSVKPVPFLTIENGKNAAGRPVYQKILLVGPGKSGFKPDNAQQLTGKTVKISGFLIYSDGKTACQVENISAISGPVIPNADLAFRHAALQASVTLRGEIADPKCLLGVMNPGEGKPHLDCAVRCISGGLPPLLKVSNMKGETEYYLLVGADGAPINEQLLNYVGSGVQLCGRLEQQADWLLLYTDLTSLKRIDKDGLNPGPMCN